MTDLFSWGLDGGTFALTLGILYRMGALQARVQILENRLKFKLLEA